MIYCPNCGTSNRKGSRFCNECGEPLPSTGMRCPMCDTINAVGNVYCQACNARLVPMSAPTEGESEDDASRPIKGVSLPTIPLDEDDRKPEEPPEEPAAEESPSAPNWLAELRESAEDVPDETEEEEMEVSEPFTSTDVPDWLSEMGPIGEESAGGSALGPMESSRRSEMPAPEPGDIPDWIRELGPVSERDASPAEEEPPIEAPSEEEPPAVELPEKDAGLGEPPTAEADQDEGPDWLRDILDSGTETGLEAEAAVEPDHPAEEESLIEIPEWLTEGGSGVPPRPPKTPPAEEPSAEEPVPSEEPTVGEPTVGEPTEEESTSDVSLESIAIPSWLAERQGGVEEPLPGEPPPPFTEKPPEDVETPEWLSELMTSTAEEEAEEDVAPFADEELEMPEPEGETDLTRADIPGWLQELRPGRGARRREPVGPLETEGLLKGLRGVIPSTDAMAASGTLDAVIRTREPDEASLARAELLQSLLGQPTLVQRERVQKKTTRASGLVERIIVALILVTAVAGMLLAPLFVGPGPHLTRPFATAGATRLYDLVEGLDDQAPVLVAFDYGPPEADELNAAAHPVLRHLLDRGATLSIVSTRPEGSLVAEDLMADVARAGDEYRLVGYRPGAAVAASQLLAAADETPSLLLVLSGQPLPLLLWIEQANAAHGDRLPVVAVGSAALEPFASPYLDAAARQLGGAIFGYKGGSSYEEIMGTSGDATRRLDALAAGHLAIILAMIGGAFVHALSGGREESA